MSETIITPENIENRIITTETDQGWAYVPSSIEKKKAVMMYMLFGIIITLSSKKVNVFEYFHLKQSMWRWLCFIVVLVASVGLMLVPGIKYLGLIALFFMVIFFIILVKQAWGGKYRAELKWYTWWFFPALGGWVVNIFDISPEKPQEPVAIPTSIQENVATTTNIDQITSTESQVPSTESQVPSAEQSNPNP